MNSETTNIVITAARMGECVGGLVFAGIAIGGGRYFLKLAHRSHQKGDKFRRNVEIGIATMCAVIIAPVAPCTWYDAIQAKNCALVQPITSIDDCMGLMTTRVESMTDWRAKSAIAYRAQNICQRRPNP